MDLASYADLAIELVNTQRPHRDELRDLEGLRALLLRRPHLEGRTAHRDLDAIRELRAELRAIFVSADRGDAEDAIERLNTLLIRHPVHPQMVRHDGQDWHLHFNEEGSIPDRVAARTAMGLAAKIGSQGLDRFGVCQADGCGRVYLDATSNRSRRYCSDRCAGRSSATAACHPSAARVSMRRAPARESGQ
ncbi:CGNR zinc finger domain-containing protein [Actinomadura rubrisoli]|uniref:Zf-CGNR multi-domain protein n=1 Tax=Actinomadura rubrisoli TaxID=2530368 RepID=A0A4R5C1W8_9ACTN|nr:CGNR zinc finger domain-containing protein [Actinomadura rubrisoli]TDD93581.1 zf-CGNR multi-domain protein [Actinomadura rubrisoli]